MPAHLFFDTTELSTWRVRNTTLESLLTGTGSLAFVSSLSLEEVAWQQLRMVRRAFNQIEGAIQTVRPYVEVSIGRLSDDQELINTIRAQVQQKKPPWLTEIPVDGFVSLPAVLEWSTSRRLPFRGESDPKGFHDAVIFLSYLNFAKTGGLNPCYFVSTNSKDFPIQHVKATGQRYGTTWELLLGLDGALSFLRDPELSAAVTRAFDDPRLIAEYVRQNLMSEILAEAADAIGEFEEIPRVRDLQVGSTSAVLGELEKPGKASTVKLETPVTLTIEARPRPRRIASGVTVLDEGVFRLGFNLAGEGVIDLAGGKVSGEPHIIGMLITRVAG